MALAFDHLHLSDNDRSLIANACKGGTVVYLGRLDKGLSGGSLWQARWMLRGGNTSKDHVFKIGPRDKLEREIEAIKEIVSVIEEDFPHMDLVTNGAADNVLLRQQFLGDASGNIGSLRNHIRHITDAKSAREVMRRLYFVKMSRWHPKGQSYRRVKKTVGRHLFWWLKRKDIGSAVRELGKAGIEKSLDERALAPLGELVLRPHRE